VALNVSLELFETPFTMESRPLLDPPPGATVVELPPPEDGADVEVPADPELHAATRRPPVRSEAALANTCT
jgi:hypothetical protein